MPTCSSADGEFITEEWQNWIWQPDHKRWYIGRWISPEALPFIQLDDTNKVQWDSHNNRWVHFVYWKQGQPQPVLPARLYQRRPSCPQTECKGEPRGSWQWEPITTLSNQKDVVCYQRVWAPESKNPTKPERGRKILIKETVRQSDEEKKKEKDKQRWKRVAEEYEDKRKKDRERREEEMEEVMERWRTREALYRGRRDDGTEDWGYDGYDYRYHCYPEELSSRRYRYGW